MDYPTMQELFKNLVDNEPFSWGSFLAAYKNKKVDSSDLKLMTQWARHRMNLMARLSVYLDQRGGNGCGDIGHEKALEASRKVKL